MIRVAVYNEFLHEKEPGLARDTYPEGIHTVLKNALQDEFSVKTYTLDNIDTLTPEALKETDVWIHWGHMGHDQFPDEAALMVKEAVLEGMGAVFLHSGHHSKPFKLLMGTSCNLNWRENGDREYVWVCNPSHPIAAGIDRYIKLDHEETYGEPFAIPEPDETVFIGNFEGGEVMRAGCCWKRENGKIFYFQPGHETFPTYYNPDVIKVIKNAVRWAAPTYRTKIECPHVKKPE